MNTRIRCRVFILALMRRSGKAGSWDMKNPSPSEEKLGSETKSLGQFPHNHCCDAKA